MTPVERADLLFVCFDSLARKYPGWDSVNIQEFVIVAVDQIHQAEADARQGVLEEAHRFLIAKGLRTLSYELRELMGNPND